MKKSKKILLIVFVVPMLLGLVVAISSKLMSNDKNTIDKVNVIVDTTQFSGITTEELKSILGEPELVEEWTNTTQKGNFNFTSFEYNVNGNHYSFNIFEDSVVSLIVEPPKYYDLGGDVFHYTQKNKKDILQQFNIELGSNGKKKADTGFALIYSPVNEKIGKVDIQFIDTDNKTFEWVKVIYNLNYFD